MVYRPRYLSRKENKSIVAVYGNGEPYLRIELDQPNSVPTISYDGKEIENIKSVEYSWETGTSSYESQNNFLIEYYKRINDKPRIIKEGFESVW
ncbi:hypothetical protein [uncultured Enterococcus sp.]|uniref:hypothetical protein n=1 Tax=uncultured Enterococcus sp. TaxID=167972 RepID=UPI002AA7AFBD|nr:hypothetical protein [uncultured Enterococcus sp.]